MTFTKGSADSENAGKTTWTATLSGVTESKTVAITAEDESAQPTEIKVTLTTESADVVLPDPAELTVTDGSVSFSVSVTDGKKPVATDVTFTKGSADSENSGKTTWTATLSGVTESKTVAITAEEETQAPG